MMRKILQEINEINKALFDLNKQSDDLSERKRNLYRELYRKTPALQREKDEQEVRDALEKVLIERELKSKEELEEVLEEVKQIMSCDYCHGDLEQLQVLERTTEIHKKKLDKLVKIDEEEVLAGESERAEREAEIQEEYIRSLEQQIKAYKEE
jgi:hypothetical protein